jgi:hypothetical protein
LTTPTGITTTDTRPAIRWSAVRGAIAYALKVQSRVPEGRLVASFDTVVTDTQFVPPSALADERVKVTVSVAARCAGEAGIAATAWFLIDATAQCPAPTALRVRREPGRGAVEWSATPGATAYEVRVHAPLDGRVIKVTETREARVVIEGDLADAVVLSVRPRCTYGFGEVVIGFVTN